MNLYAPNIALFVVAGCLAMIGVLSALPIELPIPGLGAANAAWYIFLAGSCWRRAACCRLRRAERRERPALLRRPQLSGTRSVAGL
jgi:hypothetical protein